MNLTIVNRTGAELDVEEVTLTRDGFKIVVGEALGKPASLKAIEDLVEDLETLKPDSESSVAPPPEPKTTCTPPPGEDQLDLPLDKAEVDASGVVWDERIHAKTQTKTADGNWKKRRGVDPDLLATVTAELLKDVPPPAPVSTERPTPKKAPPPPPASAPGSIFDDMPTKEEKLTPKKAPPPPPASIPVPENNVIGDTDDEELNNILADWG